MHGHHTLTSSLLALQVEELTNKFFLAYPHCSGVSQCNSTMKNTKYEKKKTHQKQKEETQENYNFLGEKSS